MTLSAVTMHDLFRVSDDRVIEAARMLAKHDMFVIPGCVMRDILNTLRIIVNESDDIKEALRVQELILQIKAAWTQATGTEVDAGRRAP